MADRNRVTGSAAALRGNSWDPRPDPNSLPEQISRLAKGFGGLVHSAVNGIKGFSLRSSQSNPSSLPEQIQGLANGFGGMVNSAVDGMRGFSLRSQRPPVSPVGPGQPQEVEASIAMPQFGGMAPFSFGDRLPPAMPQGRGPLVGMQPLGLSPLDAGQMGQGPGLGPRMGFNYPMQGPPRLQGDGPVLPLGRSPVTPVEYGPSSGMGVGPQMSFQNPPNILNQANPSGMLPNQVYPGQGPLMRGEMPSFAGAIPPDIRMASQQAGQEAGLAGLISRMREVGQGLGPNAQAGLAADQAAYNDAYGRAAQVGRNDVGLTEQERANWNPQQGYGFADSAVQSAASGGAIGAGMRDRFVGRNPLGGTESVSMNPDGGLGYIERTEGRYGQSPLRINRQMSDQEATIRAAQEKAARTGTNPLDHLQQSRLEPGSLSFRIKNTPPEVLARLRQETAERGAKFREEHGGLNRKEFRRQRRIEQSIISQFRREGASAETMAKLLAPRLAERLGRRRGGAGNPSSPVTGNAPAPPDLGQATPAGIQQSQAYVAQQEPTTALAQANGWTPETPVADIRTGIDGMLEKGLQLQDADLVDLHRAVKSRAALAAAEGGNAFDGFSADTPRDMAWAARDRKNWEVLVQLGEDPKKLRQWQENRRKEYESLMAEFDQREADDNAAAAEGPRFP